MASFDRFAVYRELAVESSSKIVLLVLDGLGGLPHPETGRTELEAADTPHLDLLAKTSVCGLTVPVGPGITPGSGPGHLALFGYDPYRYRIGRGALEALGIDFDLGPEDVAARGNFCTVDGEGRITDRRAGRISTEECAARCRQLRGIQLPGVELFVEPVWEHRFLLVLRGPGLSDDVGDTDPQRVGVEPLAAHPGDSPPAGRTAELVNRFVAQAAELLRGQEPANMLTLRGFARWPEIPSMTEVFKLRAAAVAVYPMYRGLAKLVGMRALAVPGERLRDQLAVLQEHWEAYDYFFVHYKRTDTAGEDGDFEGKRAAIEEADRALPALLALKPDVLVVTGDHSTPAVMAAHSWHPVPFLLHARHLRPDGVEHFDEVHCARGSLGTFPAVNALPLALACAGRLTKYGA